MGSTSRMCLSWSEFNSSLTATAQNLREYAALVDVTLSAGGRIFTAHRLVLSAASPLLMDLLKSAHCQHPIVMLAGVSAADLEAILEFVYQGEVNIYAEQLPSLLQAAQYLNIKALSPHALTATSNGLEEKSVPVNSDNNKFQYNLKNRIQKENIVEVTKMKESPTGQKRIRQTTKTPTARKKMNENNNIEYTNYSEADNNIQNKRDVVFSEDNDYANIFEELELLDDSYTNLASSANKTDERNSSYKPTNPNTSEEQHVGQEYGNYYTYQNSEHDKKKSTNSTISNLSVNGLADDDFQMLRPENHYSPMSVDNDKDKNVISEIFSKNEHTPLENDSEQYLMDISEKNSVPPLKGKITMEGVIEPIIVQHDEMEQRLSRNKKREEKRLFTVSVDHKISDALKTQTQSTNLQKYIESSQFLQTKNKTKFYKNSTPDKSEKATRSPGAPKSSPNTTSTQASTTVVASTDVSGGPTLQLSKKGSVTLLPVYTFNQSTQNNQLTFMQLIPNTTNQSYSVVSNNSLLPILQSISANTSPVSVLSPAPEKINT